MSWTKIDCVDDRKRNLFRFSCVMVEAGGKTLSEPLGEKLLVIHVTFSSTTFT